MISNSVIRLETLPQLTILYFSCLHGSIIFAVLSSPITLVPDLPMYCPFAYVTLSKLKFVISLFNINIVLFKVYKFSTKKYYSMNTHALFNRTKLCYITRYL